VNPKSRIDPHDPLEKWESLEKCLNSILKDGCVPAADVFEQGSQCGFNPKQMRAGAHRLGIQSLKSAGFGSDGSWVWYTAAQRQELLAKVQDVPTSDVGWAVPTTLVVKAPTLSETAGGEPAMPAAVNVTSVGGQSPPCKAPAASTKSAVSLEKYGELLKSLRAKTGTDKKAAKPLVAKMTDEFGLPDWKRPRTVPLIDALRRK